MLLAAHLNHLTLAGYRPETINARRKCLLAFEEHSGLPLPDATRLHIEAYLARPLAPESRRAYRSHLRAFYLWALDERYISADPTVKVPSIRVPRAMPRPIGEADLALALNQAPLRMRTWLLLMSLAGLRACEVSGLRPCDLLDTDAGTLLFLRETKGGGSATVPAHPLILNALRSLRVRDGVWWSVGARGISREVSEYLTSCGIRATGHQLRHYAGTAWYRASGHDLLTTATLLRHATVATSQTYAALDPVRPSQVVHLVAMPNAS